MDETRRIQHTGEHHQERSVTGEGWEEGFALIVARPGGQTG